MGSFCFLVLMCEGSVTTSRSLNIYPTLLSCSPSCLCVSVSCLSLRLSVAARWLQSKCVLPLPLPGSTAAAAAPAAAAGSLSRGGCFAAVLVIPLQNALCPSATPLVWHNGLLLCIVYVPRAPPPHVTTTCHHHMLPPQQQKKLKKKLKLKLKKLKN